ncbi:Pyrimidine-specific ribonucleoside hydrolase RihA [Anatilimnocola aggregata]|uniref:Pyrimidine-specific ribonucleoside hydrolase RihA n=1 Tax=Anatilimnocola aggregata TaxID=2528021 RepID=A0A517YIR3_9BACT|nr:nucleoside hydrolase [Anatilimnocola aggregata]QDU30104.1 Pyrimidine-specific ribonucleoside hydrolase RihA [Anatilimnocola aggregata]
MKLPLTRLLASLVLVTSSENFTVAQAVAPAKAASSEPIPVIIDTDIGGAIDDAFALGLAIVSPELEILGITTVGGGNEYDRFVGQSKDRDDHRAWLTCRFLTQVGAKPIPVAAGAEPQHKTPIDNQIQYRRHPAAIYNRTMKPAKESAVELMAKLLKERDDVTIIALGPLTNVARLLKDEPTAAKRIKRIVIMGGAIDIGYDGSKRPEPEWNLKTDIAAAQQVFASSIPLTLVPLDVTANLALTKELRTELFAAQTPLTWQLQNLYELWNDDTPILFDPVAIAATFSQPTVIVRPMKLKVTTSGLTTRAADGHEVTVASQIDIPAFLQWYVDRITKTGERVLPRPVANLSTMIEVGSFPAQIHTFENYETDIEKRWWMCGKVERAESEAKLGQRVCRAVLTQDFDDRQGDTKAMYRAVIFNPVPGPPMGPNTRLRFQYKLSGTDTLRIQLYSLTNGYHRYLSLQGLQQDKWQTGCVDMTAMRRPDGTGGPLAVDERIDDIQFYVDPRAELLIDNIALYEAAPASESRPFPRRIHYTGWFDTGKQGVEWQGAFEIVEYAKPRKWKFARSLSRADGSSQISLSLRGQRELDEKVVLQLKLQAPANTELKIQLLLSGETQGSSQVLSLPADDFQTVFLQFKVPTGTKVDEIQITSPAGVVFGIDDVLLFTPAE